MKAAATGAARSGRRTGSKTTSSSVAVAPVEAASATATAAPARTRRASTRRTNARATTAVLDLVGEASAVEGDAVIDLSPPAETAPTEVPAGRETDVVAGPDPRLLALGLPVDLTPSTPAAGDVRAALCARIAELPSPPLLPRETGVVIAIVGIGIAASALARRLADELDLDAGHVLVRTPESIGDLSDPDEANAFRRSCGRRSKPTIVACTLGAGGAQLRWANRILRRLEPAVTWAVVDASVKVDDVRHRIELLGGVDVVALAGLAETGSPAALLELGIPIGRIGSNPATPQAWADLLTERLER